MYNSFIWTDLSTFDVKKCQHFYRELFGWRFVSTPDQSMQEDYHLAFQGNTPVAAVFKMPANLQKINMPSFWMSYIWVEDVAATVAKARTHQGVIIEVEPTAFDASKLDASSKIALIRDPSGAGFTVYEGENLRGRFAAGHGRPVWNVHHVGDIGLIADFYSDVFGWRLQPSDVADVHEIYHASGELIAHVEIFPDDARANKQYWMPIFAVDDVAKSKQKLQALGGAVIMDLPAERSMCADPQGGHFFLEANANYKAQAGQTSQADASQGTHAQNIKGFKWKALLGLIIVWWAVMTEANWLWGILFLLWVIPDLRARATHFLEYITAKDNPILYWAIMGSWLLFAGYLILSPLFTL